MKRNGFTLIELVVVIVVLGILAVTGAPRFLNLQSDARNSALKGLKGAVKAGLEVGYGKMTMAGLESVPYIINKGQGEHADAVRVIPIKGCEGNAKHLCIFRYGYPEANFYTITTLVDGINKNYQQDKDWGITKVTAEDNVIIITDTSNLDYTSEPPKLVNNNCYLRYTDATLNSHTYRVDIIPCQ
ncbi:prepilin-type N-terminal cleavage/methylation domain-containing protein [uncultured Photobacterium sp.]|uniref:prepilin-type N-terminal cleavage/methylation domain-containing protein n=1 Tax=uncultured Photobacterium sp. TaxID=173973 RepID=UPI0026362A70|nr:prepilin-type N-terminal cleavage/methylation domain-containing protein [uncultured Photobacterium sp.]